MMNSLGTFLHTQIVEPSSDCLVWSLHPAVQCPQEPRAMPSLLRSHSLLLHCVAWFFLAALFCDSVDLDDLFEPGVVLHDDVEILGACAENGVAREYALGHEPQRSLGLGKTFAHQRLHRVRVFIDQDSPSLAANRLSILLQAPLFLKDSPEEAADQHFPADLLYLRFRSLLI